MNAWIYIVVFVGWLACFFCTRVLSFCSSIYLFSVLYNWLPVLVVFTLMFVTLTDVTSTMVLIWVSQCHCCELLQSTLSCTLLCLMHCCQILLLLHFCPIAMFWLPHNVHLAFTRLIVYNLMCTMMLWLMQSQLSLAIMSLLCLHVFCNFYDSSGTRWLKLNVEFQTFGEKISPFTSIPFRILQGIKQ